MLFSEFSYHTIRKGGDKMRKITSFLVVLLTIAALFGANNVSAQTTFQDVPTSVEYYDAVETLVELGAISTKNKQFNPSNNVTRGQAAKMIAITLRLDTKNVQNPGFKDVPTSHEFYPYIAALANNKIINGYSNGNYGINDPLRRGQMAKIIARGFDLPLVRNDYFPFEDVAYSSELTPYIETLYYYEITKGTSESQFSPNAYIKRSQLALFIDRTLNKLPVIESEERFDLSIFGDEYSSFETKDSSVVDYYLDYENQTVIFTPIVEGQTVYIAYDGSAILVTVEEVDGELQATAEPLEAVPTEYKLLAEYDWYSYDEFLIHDAVMEPLSSNAGEIEDGIDHNLPADDYYEYIYASLENPGDVFLYTLTSTTGETQQYILEAIERDFEIETLAYEVTADNQFNLEYYDLVEDVEFVSGDASGLDITVYDTNFDVAYSKPGTYQLKVTYESGEELVDVHVFQYGDYIGYAVEYPEY